MPTLASTGSSLMPGWSQIWGSPEDYAPPNRYKYDKNPEATDKPIGLGGAASDKKADAYVMNLLNSSALKNVSTTKPKTAAQIKAENDKVLNLVNSSQQANVKPPPDVANPTDARLPNGAKASNFISGPFSASHSDVAIYDTVDVVNKILPINLLNITTGTEIEKVISESSRSKGLIDVYSKHAINQMWTDSVGLGILGFEVDIGLSGIGISHSGQQSVAGVSLGGSKGQLVLRGSSGKVDDNGTTTSDYVQIEISLITIIAIVKAIDDFKNGRIFDLTRQPDVAY